MQNAAERTMWDELRALLRALAAIFGDPVQLHDERVLPRREAAALRSWLAALEAAARALLLLMAARLPHPEPRPARAARKAPRGQLAAADTPDPTAETPSSERWAGVVFRAIPASGGSRGPRRARPLRFVPSRPLAYRLEALIRVAESPGAYARRLARRLHASPALRARVLKPAPACLRRPPPWGDLPEAAQTRAAAAAAAFDSG